MNAPPALDAPWDRLPERRRWLKRFRRTLARDLRPLARLICDEVGKPEWEAITADLLPLLVACRWLERRAPRLLASRALRSAALTLGTRGVLHRQPLGDVAIIATWNYPAQLLGIQLAHALIAGNRVVVKPSERAPRTQGALCRLAQEAGLPAGVLEVTDAAREAGERLLATRRFDHVVFTGSAPVGNAIARRCAQTLTPTTLELSGRDSALVLADADPYLAARSIWHAVASNAGQTCMAPRRALVERAAYGPFCAAIEALARAQAPVQVICEAEAERVRALVDGAVRAGGRVVPDQSSRSGRTITPTAVLDCPESCALVEGDHFGPAIAVVQVDSAAHALVVHRRCGPHLSTSVFTRSPGRAHELAMALGSSTVTINDCVVPVGHPGVSIGGRGLSGWGVSRGEEGLLAMTRPVVVTRTGRLLRAPVGPPTPALARWLPVAAA